MELGPICIELGFREPTPEVFGSLLLWGCICLDGAKSFDGLCEQIHDASSSRVTQPKWGIVVENGLPRPARRGNQTAFA
jgi:hypothetical protein